MRNRDPASFSCILIADSPARLPALPTGRQGLVSFGEEVIQSHSRSEKGTS